MELGVEDRDAGALWGERVGIGHGRSLDKPVQTRRRRSSLRGVVVLAEEPGHLPAKALVGEAGDGVDDEAERAGQGHGALVPEAERSGSLALPYVGLVDALEERRADGTALAGTFDHKHAVVDLAGLGDQLGQVLERGQDTDVGGFVDNGLDAEGPALLEVSA